MAPSDQAICTSGEACTPETLRQWHSLELAIVWMPDQWKLVGHVTL